MQKRDRLGEIISYPCSHFVQGLILLSPDLETLFGEPATTPPPKTVINLDRARAHWKTAARARKAAEALLGADLPDLAQPHIETTLCTGLECLQLLGGTASADNLAEVFDADAYGPNADLAVMLNSKLSETEHEHMPTSEMPSLFSRIDVLLSS